MLHGRDKTLRARPKPEATTNHGFQEHQARGFSTSCIFESWIEMFVRKFQRSDQARESQIAKVLAFAVPEISVIILLAV
jgi:hypothetical protein